MSKERQHNPPPGGAPGEEQMLRYVEGEPDADARRELERALGEGHARLGERLDQMVRDRKALRAMLREDKAGAPRGMAEAALAVAERQGLVGRARPSKIQTPEGSRRWALPTAIAALVAIGAATGVYFIAGRARVERDLAAQDREKPWSITAPVPDETEQARASGPGLPRLPGSTPAQAPPPAKTPEPADGERAATLDAEGFRPALDGDAEPEGIDWASVFDRDRRGASVGEAAELAMLENVRLVVPAQDPRRWLPQARTSLSAFENAPDRERLEPEPPGEMNARGEREFSVEFVVRLDDDLAALQDKLFELRSKYDRGEGSTGDSYFEPVASGESDSVAGDDDAPVVLPSRKVDHVLWWSNPTEDWLPYVSVRVPVVVRPAD